MESGPTKAERRAARATVGAYHQAELAKLVEHLRDALARYDAGDLDAFEFDEIVHRYKRATQKLWSFCTRSSAMRTAGTIEWLREEGETPDWWEQEASRRMRV